ncbi:MAG: hypothetical protein WB714_18970 [Candidatus Sulfotelmatobacter sp.]
MSWLLSGWEEDRPKKQVTTPTDRLVCDVIELCYENYWNLVFDGQPRLGKSEKALVYGPARWTKTHPNFRHVAINHNHSLAHKFTSAFGQLIKKYGFTLEYDRSNEVKIVNSENIDPTYAGYGIASGYSGKGCNRLLLDDLISSGSDAMSEKIRESVQVNVVSQALNRGEPYNGNPFCWTVMGARLHEEDTVGWFLKQDWPYVHLHLPAVNPEGNLAFVDNRYTGEKRYLGPYDHLTPRYPPSALEQIKTVTPEYYWQAQYMGDAKIGANPYFDVDKVPRYQYPTVGRVWIAVDAAQTATKGGSYSAFCCLGLGADGLKVVAVRRGRWRQDELQEQLKDFYQHCGRLTGILPEALIIERAAAGFGLIDFFSGRLPVIPLIPKGSKEERAGSVCWLVNQGRVAFPQQADWLPAFESELRNFPLGSFADQVDAFVHSLSYAARPSEFQPTEVPGQNTDLDGLGMSDQDSALQGFLEDEPNNMLEGW